MARNGIRIGLRFAVLTVLMILNFVLGPPLPRGVPGEGPDCHCLKEIVGFGPIPARIRGFVILILALSTARSYGAEAVGFWSPGLFFLQILHLFFEPHPFTELFGPGLARKRPKICQN